MILRPFFRFYGAKWRAVERGMYPHPLHSTIVEPFAGSAGYALHYADRDVILVEIDPIIAGIWRWLIAATSAEVLSIDPVDSVDDLPADVPIGARSLVGFAMNAATSSPRRTLSAGGRKLREQGRTLYGWTVELRQRVADQVPQIKHWQIIEGNYTLAPDIEGTHFIDSPYERQGIHYRFGSRGIKFGQLASWCQLRRGQPIVCEQPGATWLPFRSIGATKSGPRSKSAQEALWP